MNKQKRLFAIYFLVSCLSAAAPLTPALAEPSLSEELAADKETAAGEPSVPLYEGFEGYGLCIDPGIRYVEEPRTVEEFQDMQSV